MNLLIAATIVVIVVIIVVACIVHSRKKTEEDSTEGFTSRKESFASTEVLPGIYGAMSGTSPVREAFGGGSGGSRSAGIPGKGGVVKIEYFFHPSCPSCVAYNPVFEKARAVITRDFPGMVIGKYSVTEKANQERMKKATNGTWTTIPCVVLWYSNGGKVYLDETRRNHLVEYVNHTESSW